MAVSQVSTINNHLITVDRNQDLEATADFIALRKCKKVIETKENAQLK